MEMPDWHALACTRNISMNPDLIEAGKLTLAALGGVTVIGVIIGVLAKLLAKQLLAKDLARHKSELQSDVERLKDELRSDTNQKLQTHKNDLDRTAQREIEHVRTQLAIMANQQQVIFSEMHKKRAEVIGDIYAKLVKAQTAIDLLRTIGAPDTEKAKEAREAVKTFTEAFDQTRIYFTGEICETLLTADTAMGVAIDLYATSGMVPWGNDKQLKAMKDMRQQTAVAREKLEREFRIILGVVKENPVNAHA
jgi:hypothetical protein